MLRRNLAHFLLVTLWEGKPRTLNLHSRHLSSVAASPDNEPRLGPEDSYSVRRSNGFTA